METDGDLFLILKWRFLFMCVDTEIKNPSLFSRADLDIKIDVWRDF